MLSDEFFIRNLSKKEGNLKVLTNDIYREGKYEKISNYIFNVYYRYN